MGASFFPSGFYCPCPLCVSVPASLLRLPPSLSPLCPHPCLCPPPPRPHVEHSLVPEPPGVRTGDDSGGWEQVYRPLVSTGCWSPGPRGRVSQCQGGGWRAHGTALLSRPLGRLLCSRGRRSIAGREQPCPGGGLGQGPAPCDIGAVCFTPGAVAQGGRALRWLSLLQLRLPRLPAQQALRPLPRRRPGPACQETR